MGVLFDVAPAHDALALLLNYNYPSIDLAPVSRTTSLAARTLRTKALASLVEDFDTTIDNVARLETTLSRLMSGLKERRARIKTALAPVTGLPTETLRDIFLIAAAQDTAYTTSRAHIIISHVSSHWRAVSLGIKQLWTTVHYPGLLHECAERSRDLPLDFTPGPAVYWPSDLELTAAEASRVSTWTFRQSVHVGGEVWDAPPMSFTDSLLEHLQLLRPHRLAIAGPNGARGPSTHSEALWLTDEETRALTHVSKEQMSEYAFSNVSVSQCNDLLSARNLAPHLSHLRFSAIYGDELPDFGTDDDEAFERAFRIEPIEDGGRIRSLTVSRCPKDIYFPILADWVMPNLVSLILDISAYGSDHHFGDGSLLDSLRSLFSRSTQLETMDITCNPVTDELLEAFRPPNNSVAYPAPRLHSLRVCCPEYRILWGRDVIQIFEFRAKFPITSPRKLTVCESVMDLGQRGAYRAIQCTLTAAPHD